MGTHPIFESDFDCLTDMKSQIYVAILCLAFLVSLTKGYSWQEPSKRGNIFNMISQLGENSDNEEILDRLFGTPKASVQLNPLFFWIPAAGEVAAYTSDRDVSTLKG